MSEKVGPHDFTPLKWYDRLFSGGRCSACYYPKYRHPMPSWRIARPLGDSEACTAAEATGKEFQALTAQLRKRQATNNGGER